MTIAAARARLLELFAARAVAFGDFTLASGKKSSYYINSKKVLFHGEAIALLGELLYDATRDLDLQAVGGLEVGAIPMATASVIAGTSTPKPALLRTRSPLPTVRHRGPRWRFLPTLPAEPFTLFSKLPTAANPR